MLHPLTPHIQKDPGSPDTQVMVNFSVQEGRAGKCWLSYSLMVMGMGAPGLWSPVPVTDVKNCSVLDCSLTLLCEALSGHSTASESTTHSAEGHLHPWDAITDSERGSLGHESPLGHSQLCNLGSVASLSGPRFSHQQNRDTRLYPSE